MHNFLRPYCGVAKRYLGQYVTTYEWARYMKAAAAEFFHSLPAVSTKYVITQRIAVHAGDYRGPGRRFPVVHGRLMARALKLVANLDGIGGVVPQGVHGFVSHHRRSVELSPDAGKYIPP